MASVNKVTLVGHLGRDPEMKTFPSGDQIANVTIATTEKWKDKNTGEQKEETEWNRVVFNGRLAEIVGQYLRKGSLVYVEGSLKTRKWTDQASGQERYATEIKANSMQMLGGKGESHQQDQGYIGNSSQRQPALQRQAAPQQPQQRAPSGFDAMDSDIPF